MEYLKVSAWALGWGVALWKINCCVRWNDFSWVSGNDEINFGGDCVFIQSI